MTTHALFGGMAFEPENIEKEHQAPELTQSQPVSGPSQVPHELLQQISNQISGLAEQVSELKGELSSLKADNSALREQLSATPARELPKEETEPKDDGSWKTYDKKDFAADLEDAFANIEEVDWETEPEDDTSKWPDQEPFITKEMISEMEDDYGDMMSQIASFNNENPADFVQDDATASTGLTEERDVSEAEQAVEPELSVEPDASNDDSELDDDEIQKLLAVTEEGSTDVIENQPEATDDNDEVSDDEIQAMLAQAADSSSDSTQSQEPPAAEEVHAKDDLEKSEDDDRTAMSEDEIASLMAEVTEVAAEADPVTPTAPQAEQAQAKEDDEETVEVGFTAFQAGKDVDDDLSQESDEATNHEEEVEVVEKREVVEATFEIDMEAVKKVPAHLAIAALAAPVQVTEEGLVCKVAMPIDRASIDLIEDAVAMQVVPEPAPMEEVLDALRKSYGTISLWGEREAVMGVAPQNNKPIKGKKKNFFGRAA